MPEYAVTIVGTFRALYFVEAEDREQAEEQALNMAYDEAAAVEREFEDVESWEVSNA